MKFLNILLLTCVLNLSALADEAKTNQKIDLETVKTIIKEMRAPYQNYISAQINGSCSFSLTPDSKSLMAGVIQEGEDPTVLKKELATVSKKVKELGKKHKISVETPSIVRSINKQNNQYRSRPKFVYIQKFDFELGDQVDIDQLLVDLLDVGVTEFGPRIGANYSSNQEAAVVYRFKELDDEWFEKKISECFEKNVQKWCKHKTKEQDKKLCALSVEEIRSYVNGFSGNFSSQPVNQGTHNYMNAVNIYYPGGLSQLYNISFSDQVTLKFKGNLNTSIYTNLE